MARRAGAVYSGNDALASHPNLLVVRSWLHENKALESNPDVHGCLAAFSLFTRHYSGTSLTSAATFVNCTFADGFGAHRGGAAKDAPIEGYNCLFAELWYKDAGSAKWFNCAFNKQKPEATSTLNSGCVAKAGFDMFMAPPLVDYRLHNGATAVIGKGDASALEKIPEAYRTKDFYGHAINAASLSLGCAQEVRQATGGMITFAQRTGMTTAEKPTGSYGSQMDCGTYRFNGLVMGSPKRLGYVRTVKGSPRTILRVTHDPKTATVATWQKGLHSFVASGADTTRRYASVEGEFLIGTPADGMKLTLTPQANNAVLYVDAGSKASSPDGTAKAPYKTLAEALGALTITPKQYATVYVAAGVYNEGTMTQKKRFGGVKNDAFKLKSRVVVPANVSVVGAGSAKTFIVGAADPAAGEADMGCGPEAIRCAALSKGSHLMGFTLKDGRTAIGDPSLNNGDDFHGGGVLAELGNEATLARIEDCVITNCVARRGGGGFFGVYNRVQFLGNRVSKAGNGGAVRGDGLGNCILANCLLNGNEGFGTTYNVSLYNCTLGVANTQNGNQHSANIAANAGDIRNCLILGIKKASGKADESGTITMTKFYNCAMTTKTKGLFDKQKVLVDASCLVTDKLRIDKTFTPVKGGNDVIDAGSEEDYNAKWGELDVYGNPRHSGKKIDIGAVELAAKPKK